MLHLSADATLKVPPGELVADLSAIGTSTSAVIAQRRVNTLMAGAATAAGKEAGIHSSFRDYAVSAGDQKPPRWTAQQTVELRGGDSERLLDLVGQLQADGLVIGTLGWQLFEAATQQAHDKATVEALKALRTRAEAAAGALGMAVDNFQDVRLDEANQPFPVFNRGVHPMAMAAAMPAPVATPEPQDVTAEVSADVVLRATH